MQCHEEMQVMRCIHKLNFDVYHDARQRSQLISPDKLYFEKRLPHKLMFRANYSVACVAIRSRVEYLKAPFAERKKKEKWRLDCDRQNTVST